jgi:hypothetical protein
LTTPETLSKAQEFLDRLLSSEYPDSQALNGVPVVSEWAVIPGEDVYGIGGMASSSPDVRARRRIVPLLAIDRSGRWALVIIDHRVTWWVLDNPLPGGLPVNPADVRCRATAWVQRWLHGA